MPEPGLAGKRIEEDDVEHSAVWAGRCDWATLSTIPVFATHRIVWLVSLVASGCYMSHAPDESADAGPGTLPEGVVFDHPEGRFVEVILTDAPIPCDAVEYQRLDVTGSLRDPSVPRWMSLTQWRSGRQGYVFHTETTNIGPGEATLTIASRGAIGERVAVTWEVETRRYGRLGGTSQPIDCGVFTLRP